MTSASDTKVTLSVLTFKRPDDIKATLPLLVEQARSVPHDVEVLVVDNDTEDSARAVVEGSAPEVRYVHEPRPGIAAARNRVLAETASSAIVVFFDDDERPGDGWLRLLLEMYERERPTGVVGPVVSEFSCEADAWVSSGANFERVKLPTGTPVPAAATNNLLLDRSFLDERKIAFDERFGLSGGSDTMLTRQITEDGGTILWCDEAVVTAVIPASRLSRRWILQRVFRVANGEVRVELELAGSAMRRFATRSRYVGRGLMRVCVGLSQSLGGVVSSNLTTRARGERLIARGSGLVAGAVGYVYVEYSRSRQRRAASVRGGEGRQS